MKLAYKIALTAAALLLLLFPARGRTEHDDREGHWPSLLAPKGPDLAKRKPLSATKSLCSG